jgi:hypothetical protein
MKLQNILSALVALAFSTSYVSGAECLAEAPATVYEAEELSPQNMVSLTFAAVSSASSPIDITKFKNSTLS